MIKTKLWMIAAILIICGTCVITCCTSNDNHVTIPCETEAEEFTVTTLNVDGLPQEVLSVSVNPDGPGEAYTPAIGQFLTAKGSDFIAVQENFNFNEQLCAVLEANYDHDAWCGGIDPSKSDGQRFLIDGLNGFWRKGLTAERTDSVAWVQNYGVMDHANDAMATKGFRRYDVRLANGTELVVYNLHMDASMDDDERSGEDKPDRETRMMQLRQLRTHLLERLDQRPVIVAGDMNCYYARDSVKHQFIDYINATGRATAGDVWITLERKGHYPELQQEPVMQDEGAKGWMRQGETLEKILYINPKGGTQLTPVEFSIDSTGYVRPDGTPLGDHFPLSVKFSIINTNK